LESSWSLLETKENIWYIESLLLSFYYGYDFENEIQWLEKECEKNGKNFTIYDEWQNLIEKYKVLINDCEKFKVIKKVKFIFIIQLKR
jgi:hypothetical protein